MLQNYLRLLVCVCLNAVSYKMLAMIHKLNYDIIVIDSDIGNLSFVIKIHDENDDKYLRSVTLYDDHKDLNR